MSYAALNIRDTISSGGTLVQSKNSMKFTLSQYEESPTHSHHGQFHRAFRAIVDNIKTAPPPPDMQKMIPTQSPIVFSRMSAPQAEDLMSETTTQSPARNDSDEEYEDYESDTGEEASVADSIERERLKDILKDLMVTSNFAILSVLRCHQSRWLEMTQLDVRCHLHHPNAPLLQRRNVVRVKQTKNHLHLNESEPHLKMRMLLTSRHPHLQLAHTLPPQHMNHLHQIHLHMMSSPPSLHRLRNLQRR